MTTRRATIEAAVYAVVGQGGWGRFDQFAKEQLTPKGRAILEEAATAWAAGALTVDELRREAGRAVSAAY